MSISSLGVGSGILTQDVLDQLREVDEAAQVTPIKLNIINENDKKDALEVLDANMTNLTDSINELKSKTLYDERKADVTGSAVEVTADANTDIQDFTLSVSQIATKEIEESGSFTAEDETIANAAGTLSLSVGGGAAYTINYDETTTLKDLKASINDMVGDEVEATIVQLDTGDFRLFLSTVETGTFGDSATDAVEELAITLTDDSGQLKDTRLTSDMSVVQTGKDAEFTFNGQSVTRSSNNVSDLITGLDITLKEVGTSEVSITQDRDNIMSRLNSFVEKYNSAMTELNSQTKSSTDSEVRGIFSGESIIKGMKSSLEGMIGSVGGGVGTLYDYGFDVDKDGKMTLDESVMNAKLDENPTNVEAFFSGGTFKNADGTTTEIDGAFTEMSVTVESYTKYNATLDQFKDSITNQISTLEDREASAVERLDSKYEILKKQYAAYDAMINKYNQSADMFTQLAADGNN